jgi:hypothetical protein
MHKTRLLVIFLVLLVGAILVMVWWQRAPGGVSVNPVPAKPVQQAASDPPVTASPPAPDATKPVRSPEPSRGMGRVSIRVLHRDGAVASGVDLSLSSDGGEEGDAATLYTGSTDGAGAFTFEGLPWGAYRLLAMADGLSACANPEISERRPHEVLDLILKPAGTIAVQIQDVHQAPIEGARVQALDANSFNALAATTRTDAAGFAQFDDLPIGLYALQIESTGYATLRTPPVTVGDPPFTVTLTKGGALAGKLRTESGGYPGAPVALTVEPELLDGVRYEVASDPQGEFLLEHLPEGTVKVYGSDDVFALIPSAAFAAIHLNQVTRMELTIAEGARISGAVIDKQSGAGIPGAIVSVFEPGGPGVGWNSGPTDAAGHYEVTKFPPGRLSVRVTLIPLPYSIFALPEPLEIEFAPGESAEQVDIVIDTGSMLCGVVLDDRGVPCPEARVALGRVHPNETEPYHYENTNCDRDGRFCFPDVTFARIGGEEKGLVGAITLTANSRELRSDPLYLPLDAGTVLDDVVLELKPRPAGVVAGVVVDDRGNPALARVWLRPPEINPGFDARSAVNDVDGHFVFLDVAPGDYGLWVAAEPGARGSRRIPVMELSLQPDEHVTDLRLVLPAGGEITGRVTTEHGEPLGGIRVDAIGSSDLTGDDMSTCVTDSEGNFVLRNLAGDDVFEVMHSRSEAGARWSVDARPGDHLDIVLPLSVVEDEHPADETQWLYERETGRPLKLPGPGPEE